MSANVPRTGRRRIENYSGSCQCHLGKLVDLPDLGVLFGLLLLYIALIGPINYLVLRRLDRREWAWVTMPVLVGVFAVAAWALGVNLKGTDTIVNQLGIVRTATGTDHHAPLPMTDAIKFSGT